MECLLTKDNDIISIVKPNGEAGTKKIARNWNVVHLGSICRAFRGFTFLFLRISIFTK